MFRNKINNKLKDKENGEKSIVDYILDIKKELYLISEHVANLEYEMKKINPNFTEVKKEGDLFIKLQKDLSEKINKVGD